MGRAIGLTDCQPVQLGREYLGLGAPPPGAFQSRLGDVVDAFPSVPIAPEASLLLGVIAFKQLNFEQGLL